MDFSALTLRQKEDSSVSQTQVPTGSQPQLPTVDGDTTATTTTTANTAITEISAVTGILDVVATPAIEECYRPVSPDLSKFPTLVATSSTRVPAWLKLQPASTWKSDNDSYTVPVIPSRPTPSFATNKAFTGTSNSVEATNAASARAICIHNISLNPRLMEQSIWNRPRPVNEIWISNTGVGPFSENTTFHLGRDHKRLDLSVDEVAGRIRDEALATKTPLLELVHTWRHKRFDYPPRTRQYDVIEAVLALLDELNPYYPARLKKRQEAVKLYEMMEDMGKHKVASEDEKPYCPYQPSGAPAGSYQPRRIAPVKKPNHAYSPAATQFTAGYTASGQTPTNPSFAKGRLSNSQLPTFGQPGSRVAANKAATQSGVSPAYNVAKNANYGHMAEFVRDGKFEWKDK